MKKKKTKLITGAEFDKLAEEGKDLMPYMDLNNTVVVRPDIQRVNVDLPKWMLKRLDAEAVKLNVSRQAVIKMWLNDRLTHTSHTPHNQGHSRPR